METRNNTNARVAAVILTIFWSFALMLTTAIAESEITLEDFYSECVDKRISQCEQKAKLVDSRGENCSAMGEKALKQLKFYRDRKQELVREMIRQNIGMKRYKVNRFLTQAYNKFQKQLISNQL